MSFAEYIKTNYQQSNRVGNLAVENGLYTFTVADRKGGKFAIKDVQENFITLEDSSSFSTISRVVIPISRFSILHNVDKDLLR
jgi:hypothetical protein